MNDQRHAAQRESEMRQDRTEHTERCADTVGREPVTALGGPVTYPQDGIGLVVSAAEHNAVYSALLGRVEAAEALVVRKDEALRRAVKAHMGEEDYRIIEVLDQALALTPADMGAELARLRGRVEQAEQDFGSRTANIRRVSDERNSPRQQLAEANQRIADLEQQLRDGAEEWGRDTARFDKMEKHWPLHERAGEGFSEHLLWVDGLCYRGPTLREAVDLIP